LLGGNMKLRNRFTGFTLIELMVVVVIVAILASIAYPSYRNQVLKSRRADAVNALSQAASAQERWFTEHSSYSTNIFDLIQGGLSPEGHFDISVSPRTYDDATDCTSGSYVPCYMLTARAGGNQRDDTDCITFFLDSTGNRIVENSTSFLSTDICWPD
jgi:type IV pilus assembly protein PilE